MTLQDVQRKGDLIFARINLGYTPNLRLERDLIAYVENKEPCMVAQVVYDTLFVILPNPGEFECCEFCYTADFVASLHEEETSEKCID